MGLNVSPSLEGANSFETARRIAVASHIKLNSKEIKYKFFIVCLVSSWKKVTENGAILTGK